MATSYQSIIDAIDAAILTGVDQPGTITAEGQTVAYRSLQELRETRRYYANLLRTQSGGVGFQIHKIRPGAIC